MPGGTDILAIVGLLALLGGVCELIAKLLPRRLVDEFAEAFGDIPADPCGGPIHANRGPRRDPEVQALRQGGAL